MVDLQDVGGITPGSMPPMSHTLAEEGAAILSFKLVRGGKFQVRPAYTGLLCTMDNMHIIFSTTAPCLVVSAVIIACFLVNRQFDEVVSQSIDWSIDQLNH